MCKKNKINFESCIHGICKKEGQKLNAISRITTLMGLIKNCLVVNPFFLSQFSWMCYNQNKLSPWKMPSSDL